MTAEMKFIRHSIQFIRPLKK